MAKVNGFKVFNEDWTCRDKTYECPGKFEEDVELKLCGAGMHFCKRANDCFNYYSFDPRNHVCEVVAYGEVLEGEDICCTDKLEIVREIPWSELLIIVNSGVNNSGLNNSGDCNSGDCNSGDFNSGNHNTGNFNSGNRNSGNFNSGYFNTGYCNTGNHNTGNHNTGNHNSGNFNSGYFNSGDFNSGDFNSGYFNSGDCNSGDFNSGNHNSGNRNSGDFNSGNRNSGNHNSGNHNSGNHNSGDFNSGNHNSGNCNSGNHNSGNHNSGDFNKADGCTGVFCTENEPFRMFNKPTDWTYEDWRRSRAFDLFYCDLPRLETVEWITADSMSDDEKKAHPDYEVTGGYLKVLNIKESNQEWWESLSESDKKAILSLPNFDKAIFEDVLGIKIDNEEV